MKKHIIIAGVPRTGKSTVSQMIVKRMGFQHLIWIPLLPEDYIQFIGIENHITEKLYFMSLSQIWKDDMRLKI